MEHKVPKTSKNVSKRNANVGVRTGLQQQYHGKEVLMPTPREGGLHRWASMRGGPFPVVTQGSTGGSLFRGLALVKKMVEGARVGLRVQHIS